MTEQAGKRPVGRPTKYEKRFCDMLVEDMAAGFSVTAFAGSIGVSRSTINEWAEHPEFSEALNAGKAKRLRFWEQTAINVAAKGTGGPGAASVITFGLKNMGGDEWSAPDKHEIAGGLQVNINGRGGDADL
jgi:hypothetical protein